MKKVKTIAAILLALMIAMTSLGCSENKDNEKKGTDAENSTVQTGKENVPEDNAPEELKLPDYAFNLKDPVINFLSSSDGSGEALNNQIALFKKLTGTEIQLKFEVVAWDALQTKLASMVMAGNPPDMYKIAREVSPYLIRKDLFEPLDKYYDFNDPLWRDMKDVNKILIYKGKQLGMADGEPKVIQTIIYNKNLIEEAGLDDPRELYYKGEWTWDKFLEYARELTYDTDGDGNPDVFGASIPDYASMYFAVGTGNDIVKFNEDGTITNNLRDPNFNRAFDFVNKLGQIWIDPVSWDVQKNFAAGKIAMIQLHYWFTAIAPLNEMKKNKEISFVPLPQDPKAEKKYGPAFITDFFIPRGCDNPYAAAAWYAFGRLNTLQPDPELKQKDLEMRRKDWGWDEEDDKMAMEEMVNNMIPVSLVGDRVPGFTMQSHLWNQPFRQNWSQVVEEVYPALQEAIDKLMADDK